MSCNSNLECIKQFLIYPQSLLKFTHGLFGYKRRVPKTNKTFNEYLKNKYSMSNDEIKTYIDHWNNAPKYCCPNTTIRMGKCVVEKHDCNVTGIPNKTIRLRDVTLNELISIKKRAGIIPKYAECFRNTHCPRNGRRRYYDEPEVDICRDYRCHVVNKKQWLNPRINNKSGKIRVTRKNINNLKESFQ